MLNRIISKKLLDLLEAFVCALIDRERGRVERGYASEHEDIECFRTREELDKYITEEP